jgi:heme O synthase-like polyprenyltransferase
MYQLRLAAERRVLLSLSVRRGIQYRYMTSSSSSSLSSSSSIDIDTPVSTSKLHRKVKSKQKTSRLGLYSELSKARLSALVVASTSAGFMMAGPPFDWMTMMATCVGTGFCAASANTFNQVIEKDYDILMKRTERRPLPSGRIKPFEASLWGLTAGTLGTGLLFTTAGLPTAVLGAGNIALYAGM